MSVPALPQEVWKLILQHVPLRYRLGSCSLVSRAWRSAAAAATQDISIDLQRSKTREAAFADWLQAHGHGVSKLHVRHAPPLPKLPCQQLKDLQLATCRVQLSAGSGQLGVLQGCTRLTRLAMSLCTVLDEQGALDGLSLLVNLESLRLDNIRGWPPGAVTCPGAVLLKLTHLTRLELVSVNAEGLQHLSCLSKLCELQLSLNTAFVLSPSLAPGFALPASLQTLRLQSYPPGSVLDPAVLRPLTNLEMLHVANLALANRDGAALLAVLPALQKLQRLELSNVDANWPVVSAAYSSLVPSSTLTELVVQGCSLLVGALQQVFTPGRVLPQLRKLSIWEYDNDDDHANLWDQAAVVNAIRCCPGLQDLQCSLRPSVSAAPLTQLHSLTKLDLGLCGSLADCTATVQSATSLINLQHVAISRPDGGSVELDSLVPLTALRQLTYLSCSDMAVDAVDAEDVELVLVNEAAQGAPPDVWLQLLLRLGGNDTCRPLVKPALVQEVAQAAEQQQVIVQLQHQAAEHQQTIADLQQQLVQQQQLVADLQQQVARLQLYGPHHA